ncbi:hypothetical protein BBJ28_00005825 [Nothophytophthora sp. Chile5]|nr:hypothetical protein BBJ28_00005825 [Nothophytophthora sp. Chile5]
MDARLKETEFDVVLVGTGLVEAILAGALARVGKSVLHLDQNDYYGSNYASFPLSQFRRWTQNESAAPRTFDDEDPSQIDGEQVAVAVAAGDASLPPPRVLPMESSFACRLLAESFADDATKQELLQRSGAFSIDVSPRLMLSSEQLVELLISSGVGRYLEFAAIERTYVHLPSPASAPRRAETESDTVWEVPCSKKDVFQSKLLGMVEKRQLMKFLQFVADYGETHILHEDVKTKNERSLALGRALKRPQNKASQASDGDSDALAAYLDRPFQQLLQQHFKLSPKLQQVVVYCVGLASFPSTKNQLSARDGLAAVYRYVASIGRFTGTAFLAPLYGVSEVTQSFCRLCAVYGGVYVLRAPVDAFLLDESTREVRGIRCSDGGVLKAKHLVVNGSYADCLRLSEHKTPRGQVLRGVFVLKTSLRQGMSRLMLVVPPEDDEFVNPFAMQIVQLDAGAYACPAGWFLVQISMPLPADWLEQDAKQQELMQKVIRRLLLSAEAEQQQQKKQKASTTQQTEEPATDPSADQQTETETEVNTTSEKTPTPIESSWRDQIAWQVVFTMDQLTSNDSETGSSEARDLPANVWVCETSQSASAVASGAAEAPVNPLELHLESATANARAIFASLCPDQPFLPKSASAEQAEQDEQDGEEDAVLRAAQKLARQAGGQGGSAEESVQMDTGRSERDGLETIASVSDTVANEADSSDLQSSV